MPAKTPNVPSKRTRMCCCCCCCCCCLLHPTWQQVQPRKPPWDLETFETSHSSSTTVSFDRSTGAFYGPSNGKKQQAAFRTIIRTRLLQLSSVLGPKQAWAPQRHQSLEELMHTLPLHKKQAHQPASNKLGKSKSQASAWPMKSTLLLKACLLCRCDIQQPMQNLLGTMCNTYAAYKKYT
jgi:hypothetical protein